jgi:hypothetical protein
LHDDDIDSLFVEEPAAALPGRKDRLGLAQPAASAVGNRSAGSDWRLATPKPRSKEGGAITPL